MDHERIQHEVLLEAEMVEEPLRVTAIKVGLARSPGLEGTFIGLTFQGVQNNQDVEGDAVLTLELAEAVAELLIKAVAKARGSSDREH